MEGPRHLKRTRQDVVYDTIIFIILTFILLIVAYPLYFVIISSFSDPVAVAGGKVVFYPIGFTLDGYKEVFKTKTVVRGFANSLLYSAVGVGVNLAVTLPTAYAMSRKDFLLRKPITIFYMVTMFIGGGMMPTYLVIRDTGLLNTMWALILPGALGVYNMIVARTFFTTNIPQELMEAAKLDGCGNTRFFIYVVIPLSGAITAILFLYYGVGHWNSYFSALLYIKDASRQPIQMILRSIVFTTNAMCSTFGSDANVMLTNGSVNPLNVQYACLVATIAPLLLIYPFIQKYFEQGMQVGAVKG